MKKQHHIIPAVFLLVCFCITGCRIALPDQLYSDNSFSDSGTAAISNSPYELVTTNDEILAKLLKSMQNNETTCTFYVPEESMIHADLWLKQMVGIKELQCEYRIAADGFNVFVTMKYWDNYAIVNAYRTGNISVLNERQHTLYNRYMAILNSETSAAKQPWENALAIHDYLVNHITYILNENSEHYAYDALITGQAVCSGYTECFQTFMDLLGIECMPISGTAGDEPHIWNLLKLDDEWYHVDVTWDDPINGDGTVEHTYFNITDSDIEKDHQWDTSNYPAAAGRKFAYYAIANYPVISSQAELDNYLLKQLQSSAALCEFIVIGNVDLKTAVEHCNITVSYSNNLIQRNGYSLYSVRFKYNF